MMQVWFQDWTQTVTFDLPYLIALLVTSHAAHGLDERVSGVVDSGLDALVQGPVVGGELVPQFGVNGRSQSRGHAVVVFPQVRVVRATGEEVLERFLKVLFVSFLFTIQKVRIRCLSSATSSEHSGHLSELLLERDGWGLAG